MIPRQLPSPSAADSEIASLIATLRCAEERLEELTAGEVDVVLDSQGRAFFLRRAQEELRNIESARQIAILNALPTHIALLDAQGNIVSVNQAWRDFAGANELRAPTYGVGLNYLAVCDRAQGDGAADARRAAAGIRSILNGAERNFSLEYPCDCAASKGWALLTVTPLAEREIIGAVVMHLDITAERRAQDLLRESERRFSDLLQNVELPSVMLDCNARITYSNDAFLRLSGWKLAEIINRDWFEVFVPLDSATRRAELAARLTSRSAAWHGEFEIMTRNFETKLVIWNCSVLYSAVGDVIGSASIGEDITQKRQAETRLNRLNRLYAVLSGINSLIVRACDREELFRGACQIAVEHGRFKMAWIGLVDGTAMTIVPMASAMLEPVLPELASEMVSPGIAMPLSGNSKAARAVREKTPVITADILGETTLIKTNARSHLGIESMATLPLLVSGEAAGVLTLYAAEAEFFDEEEMRRLLQLAEDIAFAMDHIAKQERLDYLAHYDVLTGLANRHLFHDRVAQHMFVAASQAHRMAVFMIDLERFKNINYSLGQRVGDELLRQVAQWLLQQFHDTQLLARIGADQFVVVLPVAAEGGGLTQLIDNTLSAFVEHPFVLNDGVFRVAAKVGVAVYPDDGESADILLKHAEAALKKAKSTGSRYLFYTQKMTAALANTLALENRLRQALRRQEFVLHYQPKVSLSNGKLVGAEALIRWNDPETGLVPPGQFIPILEETGLIFQVGRWALSKAIEDQLRWRDAGLSAVRVAVNVSPLQLRQSRYVAEIEAAIAVDPRAVTGLELELTESLIMEDVTHSIASLMAIRTLGIAIAIDDFGTGFSSLSYLARLPIDTLKIDRSFVDAMVLGSEGLAVVSAIINVAHALRLNVVAEGVETEEQLRLLRLLKCNDAQGFLFSKPLPGDLFAARYLSAVPASSMSICATTRTNR